MFPSTGSSRALPSSLQFMARSLTLSPRLAHPLPLVRTPNNVPSPSQTCFRKSTAAGWATRGLAAPGVLPIRRISWPVVRTQMPWILPCLVRALSKSNSQSSYIFSRCRSPPSRPRMRGGGPGHHGGGADQNWVSITCCEFDRSMPPFLGNLPAYFASTL